MLSIKSIVNVSMGVELSYDPIGILFLRGSKDYQFVVFSKNGNQLGSKGSYQDLFILVFL